MRAAIYARYSSDRQRETSIDDQLRVCKTRAATAGWLVAVIHSDEEVSGSTPVGHRLGGAALLADLLAGRADVLVLEGLDRLSRDLVEQETVVRRLEHRGVRIVGVSDGYDSHAAGRKLHRGMRGLINEIYLDDLRHKTHRGLSGQVSRGFNAGGLSYGYRSVAQAAGHRLEVDPERARWVAWIFDQYAAGWSVRRIAAELNRLGVPSPRGGTWAVGAIYGSPKKGSGILNNDLYTGRYIWNRSQWTKDPDTGRRQRIERPESEWMVEDRPDLRIVSAAVWERVRARKERLTKHGGQKGKGARPRTLFGGLLVCGECGGAVVAVSQYLYGCAAHKDRGASVCRGVLVPRRVVDARLLAEVRESLLTPQAMAELQSVVAEIMRAQQLESAQAGRAVRQRLGELDGEIARLVDAIAAVGISEPIQQRLADAEAERRRLQETIIAQPTTRDAATVKGVVRAFREQLMNLREALENDIERAREGLAELLGRIQIVKDGEGVYAEFETSPTATATPSGSFLVMVAGARYLSRKRVRLA